MLNLKERKMPKSFEHIGTMENFLNRTPKAQDLRSRVEKQDLIEKEKEKEKKRTPSIG